MLKKWINGEKAEVIKAIIEHNFKVLGKHLPNNILALPTEGIHMLTSEYLCEGIIIYDTTLNKWVQYKANKWVDFYMDVPYVKHFLDTDWDGNRIIINSSQHGKLTPIVQLFIQIDSEYQVVIGGISVDSENNIILSSDIPFKGKVVIK